MYTFFNTIELFYSNIYIILLKLINSIEIILIIVVTRLANLVYILWKKINVLLKFVHIFRYKNIDILRKESQANHINMIIAYIHLV